METKDERICEWCGVLIPEARLEVAPNSLTCSKACSMQRKVKMNVEYVRAHRIRKTLRELKERQDERISRKE